MTKKSEGQMFPLAEAEEKASKAVELLMADPRVKRVLTVGSIRRRCLEVHDIDLVIEIQPIDQVLSLWALDLQSLLGAEWTKILGGPKLVYGQWCGIKTDIYYADADTWWTLVLIRTGSEDHNKKLASRAKKRDWKLHADGGGLTDKDGQRIAGDSEESFFEALGLKWVPPEKR
jgi:DNA polymerase (family X)